MAKVGPAEAAEAMAVVPAAEPAEACEAAAPHG